MATLHDTRWSLLPVLLLAVVGATNLSDNQRLMGGRAGVLQWTASTTSTSTSSSTTDAAINRCRAGCVAKHAVPNVSTCNRTSACATCWSDCSIPSNTSPTTLTSGKSSTERCQLYLTVQRMVRNESFVTADVSWRRGGADVCNGSGHGPSASSQCLVTWEVSGGGLMGNLITESSSVQLSLWSDTNYRVQVTCLSKTTNALTRSAPLVLSTSGAVPQEGPKMPAELLSEVAEGDDDEALARELDSSETYDREGHRQHRPGGFNPWSIASDGESEIAILALFVAMLLFLLVLLTIVIVVRWRPANNEPEQPDKQLLVDDDRMVGILHV